MEKINVTLREDNSHDSDLMINGCLPSGRQRNANVSSFSSFLTELLNLLFRY